MENNEKQTTLVSVCILTYNHEKYISDAIDSVLRQKIDFPIEIVIGDDCSTDATVSIINEYSAKYPGLIKLEVNKTNMGIPYNFVHTFLRCKGEFVCDFAGDDYFMDENKLAKQVAFMNDHPEYIGVGTVIQARDSYSNENICLYPNKKYIGAPFTLSDFLNGNNYPSAGMLYKNIGLEENGKNQICLIQKVSNYVDDLTFCIIMLLHGNVYILPDITYAYRVRRKKGEDNYNSLNTNIVSFEHHIELLNNLDFYMGDRVNLRKRYKDLLEKGTWYCLKQGKLAKWLQVYYSIPFKYRVNSEGILSAHSLKYCITHFFNKQQRED